MSFYTSFVLQRSTEQHWCWMNTGFVKHSRNSTLPQVGTFARWTKRSNKSFYRILSTSNRHSFKRCGRLWPIVITNCWLDAHSISPRKDAISTFFSRKDATDKFSWKNASDGCYVQFSHSPVFQQSMNKASGERVTLLTWSLIHTWERFPPSFCTPQPQLSTPTQRISLSTNTIYRILRS